MAEVDSRVVAEAKKANTIIQVTNDAGEQTGIFEGPHLPGRYFDNYTECLYKNIEANRIKTLAAQGLNEHGQTKEQQEASKKCKEEAKKKQEKADIVDKMLEKVK